MYQHHRESLDNFVKAHREKEGIIAILLGGSLAKNKERVDSDIDLMIVLTDEYYQLLEEKKELKEDFYQGCTYEGGYYDIKFFTMDYIKQAAIYGSEPTRNSFIAVQCVHTKDSDIVHIIDQITTYPRYQKQEKLDSFYSAFMLNKCFFWYEAKKRDDLYLKMRTATDIVLFGMRMLYAYNEKIFPCHKWMMEFSKSLEFQPDNIREKATTFLEKLDDESMNAFVDGILQFTNWQVPKDFGDLVKIFIKDYEQWWYKARPNIAEW